MAEWDKQLYFEDVILDTEMKSVSIPLTLQRLVMEAGANRDLSSIHHDNDAVIGFEQLLQFTSTNGVFQGLLDHAPLVGHVGRLAMRCVE